MLKSKSNIACFSQQEIKLYHAQETKRNIFENRENNCRLCTSDAQDTC